MQVNENEILTQILGGHCQEESKVENQNVIEFKDEDIQEEKQIQKEILVDFLNEQKTFNQNLHEVQTNQVETQEKLLQKMNASTSVLIHPFLNKKSMFYMRKEQEGIIQVDNELEDFDYLEEDLILINQEI